MIGKVFDTDFIHNKYSITVSQSVVISKDDLYDHLNKCKDNFFINIDYDKVDIQPSITPDPKNPYTLFSTSKVREFLDSEADKQFVIELRKVENESGEYNDDYAIIIRGIHKTLQAGGWCPPFCD